MSLGAPLDRLARDARRFADDWPREGAAIIERSVAARLRQAPGGGSVGGIGSASVKVDASPGSADVSADGSMRLWSWMENGTRAHAIAAASTRRRDALSTPYGPRRRVKVRGWRAGHTWTAGVAAADPLVVRDAVARQDKLGG